MSNNKIICWGDGPDAIHLCLACIHLVRCANLGHGYESQNDSVGEVMPCSERFNGLLLMGQKTLNGSVLWEDEVQLPPSVLANIWGPSCSTTAPGYVVILFNSLRQKLMPVLTGLWSLPVRGTWEVVQGEWENWHCLCQQGVRSKCLCRFGFW